MAEQVFKEGDKVQHKANPEFKMVIVNFATYWPGNPYKGIQGDKNPQYPVCSYYNLHTNKWEQRRFQASEIEAR